MGGIDWATSGDCDRREQLFLPACVDSYVVEDNPVRVVDLFVNELNIAALEFAGSVDTVPQATLRRAGSWCSAA